jgi:hypothetical protein
MRNDLLDAQAAVDWAISDIPILERKIKLWRDNHPYSLVGDLNSQPGKKIIRLSNVKPIPAIIAAEAGIIIHSIRSSLDILTVTLAERNGAICPTDTYFPIWNDANSFNNLMDPVGKKIKRLSTSDQAIIKNLKPYKGVNNHIAILHELDLTRKHRRLLSVSNALDCVLISNNVVFTPVWEGFNNNAIVAIGPIDASERDITLDLEVRFTKPGIISFKPIIKVLNDFASLAISIIKLFDSP